METGQITRNSSLGNAIYNLSKQNDIKVIVEFGTWNGMGSTKCVIDGLKERNDDYFFMTIELYPDMYEKAKRNLCNYLNDKIVLLHGRISNYEDLFWFDHNIIPKNDPHANLYMESDKKYLKIVPNVFEKIPRLINLCILDGGAYSTYPEYKKIKDRVKIFALDDTKVLKCKKIREELMEEKWIVLMDDQETRNGASIFKRNP